MNPFSRSRSLLLFILLLTISPVYAILDTNQNGASDLWERHHNNGNLYSNFIPTADPDGDGWTNAQEAAAGTHPDDANPPTGFLRPEITRYPAVYGTPEVEGDPPRRISPEAVSIEWTPLAGKKYSLFASSDLSLGSWIPIGEPQIGNRYFTPSFNIPLTQPDGSIPQKLFFRLSAEDTDTDSDTLTDYEENQLGSSPYYADGDHDGISDYDEFMIHHTNFNAADSDNDGVTDGDEILVNFTNPLSTTDADGDGIPDDFEKHFAKLLLAYEPKATHWGAYHTGLLAGNLDATHDYTGDGMNVRELAGILNTIPAAGPADSGYSLEQQGRRNSLQSAYYYPLQSSSSFQGTYSYSVPNDYDVYESVTLTADLSSQYLLSRIDGVAWGRPWMRSGDQMNFYNGMVESAFRRTPTPGLSSNGTKFQGRVSQQRCRLITTNPRHEAYSRTYLKVIIESNYFTWDYRGVISAEPFTVQLSKGRMLSDWYEFKAPIVDESGGRGAELTLVPVEVNSMDRYLSGSIPESLIDSFGGESKFGLVFRNPSSGETYSFNKLSEAHIYDDPFGETDEDEDKFLSNFEIAAWANGPGSASKELTQDVVFYRKDGKLHFRTIFDQAGSIEIGLIKDGQEIGKVDWTLKPDAQIADLLETVDTILSGNYDDGGGIVVAAMQAGLSEGDINALQSAAASIQSSSSSGFGGFLRRNLTIKVNIPTWAALKDNFEQGVRKAGAAVDQAITVATFTGKGFCEGAWLGIKDDINSVIELGKMALNPAETAKTFYEGFEALIELDLNGWKNVGKTLVKSFLEKGNEGAGEWAEPSTLNVASYLVGFTCGYITEQVVITYITAGGAQALKAGKIGREIGKLIKATANNVIPVIQKTANNAIRVATIKAKNSIFRRFSQDVLSIDEVKKLKRMLQEFELLCPIPVTP